MVLGFLLYEAVDFTWHFGKMVYNGTKYAYDWYYEVPTVDEIEIDKLVILEQKIDKLELMLEKIEPEHLLENKLLQPVSVDEI